MRNNNNLAMLKITCVTLRNLKTDERKLKGAILKEAAYRVYAYKYPYIDKYAGFFADEKSTAYGSNYDRNGWLGRRWNDLQRGLNWINRDWGQEAVADYANSSQFKDEKSRQAYLQNAQNGWFGQKANQNMETYANNMRKDFRQNAAYGAEQGANIDKRINEQQELQKSQAIANRDSWDKKVTDIENEQFESPGLYGGPGGLSKPSGGPEDYRARSMTRGGKPVPAGGAASGGARSGYGSYPGFHFGYRPYAGGRRYYAGFGR